jgi:hypothetical protein
MLIVLGLAACLGLWWLSKNRGRLDPRLTGRMARRAATWGALGLAGFFLLRGQIGPALVLGVLGVWLLEGPERAGGRLARFVSDRLASGPLGGLFAGLGRSGQARRGPDPRRFRSRLVEVALGPDGTIGGGRVAAGPRAGTDLDALALPELMSLRRACVAQDPEGVRLLEAYLDRRRPGWRVDAEADRDPGTGRPLQPGAMTQQEAYEVLGLERGATLEEIRAAHRRLMKAAHPDQGGSAERAARINAARDRLTYRHR